MALTVTDNNFQTALTENKVVMLDFWAEWCGPCRAIAPLVDELSDEYKNKALIGKVNVDENSVIPMEYGIRSIPTLLFFKNGVLADKHVGLAQKSILSAKLEALLK